MRVGVFFCQFNPEWSLALDPVIKYADNLPGVVLTRQMGIKPKPEPESLAELIRTYDFERVVIAGDSPGYFKPLFTKAVAMSDLNTEEIRLASFREHGAEGADAIDRAKAILACAVFGVPYSLAAVPKGGPVHHATLVIGGGIAGIQAALELANAGKQVYLVERTGTIGGHMAMFDKTFPTLDCAACILTPKMVAVAQHDMIRLFTGSTVEYVNGVPGAYRARIKTRPRYVDLKACVSCGICSEVCPVKVASEFDAGISQRKAIYIPFPQAIPNVYIIDGDHCTYLQTAGTKCGVCEKKCPKECINFQDKGQVTDIEIGNIILATGYDILDPTIIPQYGYGVFPNVITALEFERLTNASGTTGGRIVVKTKKTSKRTGEEEWIFDAGNPPPKNVAIIHCVGSRNKKYNAYCSRVCCMYSLKFSHLVKEKIPGANCYEFYIDMRAFGKGYEEFAERIREEGTFVVRGRSATVSMNGDQLVVKGEDIVQDKNVEFPVDLVILAVGLVPARGTAELCKLLGLKRDSDGWFSELDYNGNPTETERGGIFVAGMCQGPKDIPDTVAQASAVAAGVLRSISSGRGIGHRSSLMLSEIEARAKSIHTY